MHDDPAARGDWRRIDVRAPVDPGERARLVGLVGARNARAAAGSAEAAPDQDLGEHVADAELALERQRGGQLVRRELQPRGRKLLRGRGLHRAQGRAADSAISAGCG